MGLKKISLVLNTEDPEQLELYKYVKQQPSGEKRNSSAFLRFLVEKAYQSSKGQERIVIRNQGGIKMEL